MIRLAWNAYVEKKHPISVVHFVTGQCNARCAHCFVDFEGPASKLSGLSLEEIRVLSRTLGPSLYNVNLTGGEPFLRADLWEIAEAYYQNAGVSSVMITSNGFFTERMKKFVESFLASPYAESRKLVFSLSIDDFPEQHDENRRVKGLFQKCLDSYRALLTFGHPNVMPNIAITVTGKNHGSALRIYEHLRDELGVKAFTATAMREAGVVTAIPSADKINIHRAYTALCAVIHADQSAGRTVGYKKNLQGRLMNAKNRIMNDWIADTYLTPAFRSPCPAGAMFGVIAHDGTVYPCEVLDKPLGNLRDHGMDFRKVWATHAATEARRFIRDTNCNCSYECALAINIISNPKFLPELAADALRQ